METLARSLDSLAKSIEGMNFFLTSVSVMMCADRPRQRSSTPEEEAAGGKLPTPSSWRTAAAIPAERGLPAR